MKLLGTRLIVAPIKPKPISTGGIMFPQGYDDSGKLFRVLEVGQGVEDIAKGDAVLIGHWQWHQEMSEGRIIIDQKECLAVIREDPTSTFK